MGWSDPPSQAVVAAVTRERQRGRRYERFLKPAVDRVGAALLLLLLLPVLAAVAVAVWAQLGSPVLFRQPRVGRGGRVFRMYKFRTMRPDRRLGVERSPWEGDDRRLVHKSASDPRVVGVSRRLRQLSLDELPQLLNVLRGEMSLVGPRPEMAMIVNGYQDWQHGRHVVRPGMTGLWQVTERGRSLMHERIDIDIDYIARLSWRLDAWILLRTVVAAATRMGY